MPAQLPKRPRAHVLEELSIQHVRSILPPEWISTTFYTDYGLDLRIEIVAGEQVTGLEFSIQLKATDRLKTSGDHVLHTCKVSTAHYFLRRAEPVMYVVYDAQGEAAYWLWVQPYLRELDETRPGWHGQKTIRIRIPRANHLTPGNVPAIADYVRAWRADDIVVDFPPPILYRDEDLRAYLDAVIETCEYIRLPVTTERGRTLVPLERVYVALRADRSSRAERRASHEFFHSLVDERLAIQGGNYWRVVREVARLNPRAARFLRYDPRFAPLLVQEVEEGEQTHYLAEILRRHRWLVLLGDPGSGKTTLARWVALQLARALQKGQEGMVEVSADHVRPDADADQVECLGAARLPVLVRIAHYAATRWSRERGGGDTHLSLLNYIYGGHHLEGWLGPAHHIEAWRALIGEYVAEGQALFILDGLDEVTNTAHRREIAAEIERLIEDHVRDAQGCTPLQPSYHVGPAVRDEPAAGGGSQLMVTSRIVGYQVHPLPAELPHFVIQPMDDTAVRRFCQMWTAARDNLDRAEALREAVLAHSNAQVRDEIARNPLLLTVLAQVFEMSPGGQLPQRRAELYEKAVWTVFDQRQERWDQLSATLGSGDFHRIMTRLMAHLALQLHANPDYPASLAEEESVREWLVEGVAEEKALLRARRVDDVVEDVLEVARELSGFFIACGQGVYGFVHRQFQEYFAAWALKERGDAQEAFLERLDDPAWREILLLGVALSGRRRGPALLQAAMDAPDPTGGLLPHNLLFVAAALRELEHPPADLVRRVAEGLIRAYRRDDEGRFAALHEQIERAFGRLPRRAERRDVVGKALCTALQTCEAFETSRASRLMRIAAAELVWKCKWYTPDVARALAATWKEQLEPAGTLLAALEGAHAAHPEHFSGHFLPFRQMVEQEPGLWEAIKAHAHWRVVLYALYLAPGAALEPGGIVRDSVLTKGILRLLQQRPEDRRGLQAFLVSHFEEETLAGGGRDAGLALAYLGDVGIVPTLVTRHSEHRQQAHAILAAMFLVRALDLALTRNLVGNHFRRPPPLDLDRTHALDRACRRPLIHELNMDPVVEASNAYALALDRDLGRIRDLVLDLDLDRDLNLNHCIELCSVHALARAQHLNRNSPELKKTQCLKRAVWGNDWEELGIVWRALGEAWEARGLSLADWAMANRPALDGAHLAELTMVWKGENGEQMDWRGLLPRLNSEPLGLPKGEAARAVQAHLEGWLSVSRPGEAAVNGSFIARHGALLLAETGWIMPQTVPLLCVCLRDAEDLTRYRARLALTRQRASSTLGRETVETIARCYRCVDDAASRGNCPVVQEGSTCWRGQEAEIWLVDTYLGWSLQELKHDCPEWLHAWAEAGERDILRRIGHLSDEAWPTFLALLAEGTPSVQEALLDSASWLLGWRRVPGEHLSALAARLLALLESQEGDVRQMTVRALGNLRKPSEEVLKRLQTPEISQTPGIYMALARLGGQIGGAERATVEETLHAALPKEEAIAALVRLYMGQAKRDDFGPAALLAALGGEVGDSSGLLAALLRAGTDDDSFGRYHERVVVVIRELVQQDGALLGELLMALKRALDGEDWSLKRIALAAVAACAELMPDALNHVLPRTELERLLVKGARDTGSFESRRFGVAALSHLHTATPAAIKVLLTASRDVSTVQREAVTAARRFQHLSSDFTQETALKSLERALEGESAGTAYVAAQLLAALGSVPVALEVEGLRQRISSMLSQALRHLQGGGRKQAVYLSLYDRWIEYKGTLAQALFDALVEVAGLPE